MIERELNDCQFCCHWNMLPDMEYMGECHSHDVIKSLWLEPYTRIDKIKTVFSHGCKHFKRRRT